LEAIIGHNLNESIYHGRNPNKPIYHAQYIMCHVFPIRFSLD